MSDDPGLATLLVLDGSVARVLRCQGCGGLVEDTMFDLHTAHHTALADLTNALAEMVQGLTRVSHGMGDVATMLSDQLGADRCSR